jgi:arsenate reductase
MRKRTQNTLKEKSVSDQVYSVLFLCTGNSARSIMAEAILGRSGGDRFEAYSAGSKPIGLVNPFAISVLERHGLEARGLRSKNWNEFAAPGAPLLDFVFTLCDSAAGEICPVWPGQPMTAHWCIEDPAAVKAGESETYLAFLKAFAEIQLRISLFASLPIARLDRVSLKRELDCIGLSPR